MATVKMNGGKVIMKNGKVSCSCCTGCCMFAAQDLVNGLFTAADLPAAVTLLGVGSISLSGTAYGNTTNGVVFESGSWAKYVAGVRTTQRCLITGDGNVTPGNDAVEDQFAATYNFDWGTGSGTTTRFFLCMYVGPGFAAEVTYGLDPLGSGVMGWYAIIFGVGGGPSGEIDGFLRGSDASPAGSPAGVYTGGLWGNITIS